jgi:hypothetical protein
MSDAKRYRRRSNCHVPFRAVGPAQPVDERTTRSGICVPGGQHLVTAGPGGPHCRMARLLRDSTSATFVGRVHELAEIRLILDRAARGRGGVLLVAGEPGIGKTRLVEEAVAQHTGPTAWGTSVAGHAAPAFRPWTGVLRQWADERTLAAAGSAAEDLRRLADERDDRPAPADASRIRLFDGVVQVLVTVGRDGGAVAVLDDLQWADEDSVGLLRFLTTEIRHLPVLLLGTYRDTEVEPDGPLAAALPDLARAGPHLTLSGLSPAELAALAASVLDDQERRDGTRPVIDARAVGPVLHRRTGGNPFFARELLRSPRPEFFLDERTTDHRFPGGIRAVLSRRLARLPQPTHDLLSWAAVAGSTFDVDLVAAAARCTPAEVLDALDPALATRIVVPADGHRLAFAHDLVRETLLQLSGSAARTARHWALGEALAGNAGEDHERITGAAAHLVAGVAAGDTATAVRWAVRAAERSRSVLAYEDAAAWYGRALATRRRSSAGDEEEERLLLDLGSALLDAGRLPDARDAFLAAAALARTRHDAERLSTAALGLGAGLAGFEVPLFDQVQIDLLEEALAALPEADSAQRGWLLARLSVALAFVADHDRRRRLAESAAAMAERVGDEVLRAYALAAWCDTVSGPDDVDRRLAVAGDVVGIAEAAGLRPLAFLGRRLRVVALLERGRLQEAAVEVQSFDRVAEALRQPLYRWCPPLWRGTLAMAAGDLQRVERFTAEAERIGASAHSDNARVLVAVQRFIRLRHERRLDEAAGLAAGLLADAPAIAAPESLAGFLVVGDVVMGEPDRARRRADAIVATGLRTSRADSEWLADLAQLAEAAVALRHERLAALVHDALRPYAELFVVEGIGAAVCGSVAHYLAGLSRLLRRDGDAAAYADLATALHRSAGLVLPAPPITAGAATALTEMEAAPVLRREGEVWALSYAGATVRIRDSKGLRDLAVLLRAPDRAVHVCELTGTPVASSGEDLDATAVAAYRRHLAGLEEEIAVAEADSDVGRMDALRAERDFIAAELASALGLGGRPRRSGDPVERARKAVTGRIRDSISRIATAHPELGRHLAHSVRTGTWCVYAPERPVRWGG